MIPQTFTVTSSIKLFLLFSFSVFKLFSCSFREVGLD